MSSRAKSETCVPVGNGQSDKRCMQLVHQLKCPALARAASSAETPARTGYTWSVVFPCRKTTCSESSSGVGINRGYDALPVRVVVFHPRPHCSSRLQSPATLHRFRNRKKYRIDRASQPPQKGGWGWWLA